MIDTRISIGNTEVGRIRITNMQTYSDGTADYLVEFAVERVGAVGLHRRSILNFPRLKYNSLALLKQALETLDPKELELEPELDPSDLARRQHGVGKALPSEAEDPFSHH